MKQEIHWLRISYWVGAVGDFFLALQWSFQGEISPDLFSDAGYNAGMKYTAVLALSWGILLFWADRKPQARKGILLITIFPVISGLIVCNLLAYAAGFEGSTALIRSLGMGAVILLMAFSYWNAKRATTSAPSLGREEDALCFGQVGDSKLHATRSPELVRVRHPTGRGFQTAHAISNPGQDFVDD